MVVVVVVVVVVGVSSWLSLRECVGCIRAASQLPDQPVTGRPLVLQRRGGWGECEASARHEGRRTRSRGCSRAGERSRRCSTLGSFSIAVCVAFLFFANPRLATNCVIAVQGLCVKCAAHCPLCAVLRVMCCCIVIAVQGLCVKCTAHCSLCAVLCVLFFV